MKRDDLVAWLDRELDLSAYRSDHSNNGLQVEGAQEVTRAAFCGRRLSGDFPSSRRNTGRGLHLRAPRHQLGAANHAASPA